MSQPPEIRRTILKAMAALPALGAGLATREAAAQSAPIKVALITPLSGIWAREGELSRKGAQMAIDDVNAQGGIRSIGGARLQLVVADTGDGPEKAKTAAQRLVAQEPDLVAGCVGQVSAFGLAVTEVTERAGLPWLTWSYADQFTRRGFRYVFKTAIDASTMPSVAIPIVLDLAEKATGKRPQTVAIIADDTPAAQGAVKGFASVLPQAGVQILFTESFSPPISDATPVVQRLRGRKPDFIMLLPSSAPDVVQFLQKFAEFRLGVPTVCLGNLIGSPDMRNLLDPKLLDHHMTVVANWPGKRAEDVVARFTERYKEAWMTEGGICSYGDIWVLKEALERAGKPDREAVANALRTMDMTDGPARFYLNGRLKFDERGQRVGAGVAIIEWIDGAVKTVYPPEGATATAVWPRA